MIEACSFYLDAMPGKQMATEPTNAGMDRTMKRGNAGKPFPEADLRIWMVEFCTRRPLLAY